MVAALGAGVDGGLGRWKREDEPASTCIDVRELEHIAEELSVCFSVGAEEDDMRPGEHGTSDREIRRKDKAPAGARHDPVVEATGG